MRVLVACEWSNTVRDAFLARGHDAYSCDLQRAEHPNPNWRRHIRGDVRPLLRERWDLVIAHPPCTYLSLMSACRFVNGVSISNQPRYDGIIDGIAFFMDCLEANADRVCVENPRMHTAARMAIGVQHDQEVQPHWFGHPYTKATRLWLKNLPPLVATCEVESNCSWVDGGGSHRGSRGIHRIPKMRSKTFQGIADAMAEQWG